MRGLVITVLLGLTMDVTSGRSSIQLIPQYPAINGSVTLNFTGVTGKIMSFIWYKGDQVPENQIFSYFPGNGTILLGPLNSSRVTLLNDGSIQITDLRLTDGGKYTVNIQSVKVEEDINVTLTVYEPVAKPKITASTAQPQENDTFTLTCDTAHAVMITWTRNGTRISSETKLSADNKTLTFSSITREDAGEYWCEAQNPVSTISSDPYTFAVSVLLKYHVSGGSRIQLIPQYPAINGSVTLSVTGITDRIVSFIWYKEPEPDPQDRIPTDSPGNSPISAGNSPISAPGSSYNPRFSVFINGSLHINDLHITDGGTYIAQIQTERSAETVAVTLTVHVPVTQPKITASTTQPKENGTFILTCDTAHAVMLTWARPGTSISSETKLSGDNKTLSFSSITREDAGEYRCEAQNLVSKDSSDPYTVTVAYGPDKAQIGGTLFVNSGSPITLSCSADSFPPPEYQWKVNGTVLREKTEKLDINNTKIENQGTYTCVARNPETLCNATASVYVNVTAELLTNETWDVTGAIRRVSVVIVLGVVSVIGSLLLYKKMRTRNRNAPESTENSPEENPVYENPSDKEQQLKEESSYMGLHFQSEDTYVELNT